MKTGLFFGSFNPIHVGHLMIAEYFLEFTDLDRVWFIVSPQNPFKQKSSLLDQRHRFYITNLAVEDNPKMKASNIEFDLPVPSYTIDTLVHLTERYPDKGFTLIMGSDNLNSFHKWKNYEKILEDHQLYVYPRRGFEESRFSEHPNVKLFPVPQIDISATFIRNSIKEGKSMRYFMPDPVLKYIDEMNFYKQ